MDDSEKIRAIKNVFDRFHNSDEDIDTIDVCIKIEEILEK